MIHFYKYHGAGNDFILIDDRSNSFASDNQTLIENMCDRHFGIGADGLMLLRNHADYDFEMIYYNADGKQSSMCGNGGRCIVSFAHYLGVISEKTRFLAIDGAHEAIVHSTNAISLEMIDVASIEDLTENSCLLDTGSPHYIELRSNIASIDLVTEARKIRYNDRFREKGVNVNFVELKDGIVYIRTYERGVENETLACGTGVTAAAIAMNHWKLVDTEVKVKAIGGDLEVCFDHIESLYTKVWKKGPVKSVFEGNWKE